MKTAVEQLGKVGLIEDKEPTALPPNAWTELENMRCVDGSIATFLGYQSTATVTTQAETAETVRSAGQDYIAYAGETSIFSVLVGTETEIGSGFIGSGTWDSCVLGGVAIFTNGIDNPQYWGGSGNTVDLPYDETGTEVCLWSDVGFTAKLIREYKSHLFALNIEDCDGKNPRKLHWSHPAEPGTIPITWRPELADYDAGFAELHQTSGEILDALVLRDTLQIYKSDAVFSVTFTGGNEIFAIRMVTAEKEIYSRGLVCSTGETHFLVTDGDIVLYDGVNFVSIADERVRDYFFDTVSRSNRDKAFCVYYERTGEVWLCFPTADNATCNKALVYSISDNTWSRCDLPGVTTAVFGVIQRPSGWTYNGADGTAGPWRYDTRWDAGVTSYNPFEDNNPYRNSLILFGETDLYEMDNGNTEDDNNRTCFARRTELDLDDKQGWHRVLRIYPRATGDAFNVRVGAVDVSAGSTTWSDYQVFTPGSDYKLDFRVTGRQHSIEFQSEADVYWKVEGYEVDYVQAGKR